MLNYFPMIRSTFSVLILQMGLIAISAVDQQPKIKIYKDANNECKGDCALCYNAEGSLSMALEVLHEGYIRPGYKIIVKKAEFQAREEVSGEGGVGDAAGASQFKQSRPKLSQAQVKVAKSAMRQALTWNEDDDMGVSKSKALKIVVIEGMISHGSLITIPSEVRFDISILASAAIESKINMIRVENETRRIE